MKLLLNFVLKSNLCQNLLKKLRRKIMQLQIEEEALNKETDEASKEKLAKLIDEKN